MRDRQIIAGRITPGLRYREGWNGSSGQALEVAEARNGLPPWKPYRWRQDEDQAAVIDRVCRWRRSLIAAALVLELAAEVGE